jgi:hypothetical protein
MRPCSVKISLGYWKLARMVGRPVRKAVRSNSAWGESEAQRTSCGLLYSDVVGYQRCGGLYCLQVMTPCSDVVGH